jgi:tRNA threonylcarbamoyladenosine biosynthesis protein TsaB
MRLTLLIETSSISYGVALADGADLLVDQVVRRDTPAFVSIGALVESCLSSANVLFTDIGRIAVDVGPGGLASVRAGVSYANGLAFSLGRPVLGADALSLTALAAGPAEGLPILCLRSAGGGDVFAGLFRDGTVERFRYGSLASVVPELAGHLPEVALAGRHRPDAMNLLPDVAVKDTGIEFPDVRALHRLTLSREGDPTAFAPYASPLTESSELFRDRTAPA